MIALFSILSPGVAEWKDNNTNAAEVTAGDNALLESGLHETLQVDGQNTGVLKSKSVDSWLTGSDIFSAKLASSEGLTVTDQSGIAHNYAAKTTQYISLPTGANQPIEGYNVAMGGQSFYDFSNSFDIAPELDFGLSVNDPELKNLFNLGISSEDSPDDLINKFLKSFGESGLGNNMDMLLKPNNFMYGVEFDRSNSQTNNGVTCNWGDSQKVALDYAWLKRL